MSQAERGIGFHGWNPILPVIAGVRRMPATLLPLLSLVAAASAGCEAGGAEPDSGPGPATSTAMNDTSAATDASMLLAIAKLEARSGSRVNGELHFKQQSNVVRIVGQISGLTPGVHGLHVHEIGDCSADDGSSAGEHFTADESPHGAPSQVASERHAGDLGNIVAGPDGVASIDIIDSGFSIDVGVNSALDRAIVIHSEPDDLLSQPSGNAGDRIACGVIRKLALGE